MPSDSVIIAIIGLIGTSIIGPFITYRIARENVKREFNDKALQNRFYLLYCPLRKEIMNTHICSGGLYYSFEMRMYEFWLQLKKGKMKEAVKRLKKPRRTNVSYEVEYGKDFPFSEIEKIVKENIMWADAKLIRLVEDADRSNYERWEEENAGFLAEEKSELANYIFETHQKLSNRLLPKE